MRSTLVFQALTQVPNRYLLCTLTTTAMRRIHKPYTRMPETANKVLGLVGTTEGARLTVPARRPMGHVEAVEAPPAAVAKVGEGRRAA